MTAHETAECCYAMAYYLLPQYVADTPEKIIDRLSEGRVGAIFFYFMACKLKGMEPGDQDATSVTSFSVHSGSLDERNDYWIVQYTPPTKVDLSAEMNADDPATMLKAMENVVLAPYFSARNCRNSGTL